MEVFSHFQYIVLFGLLLVMTLGVSEIEEKNAGVFMPFNSQQSSDRCVIAL